MREIKETAQRSTYEHLSQGQGQGQESAVPSWVNLHTTIFNLDGEELHIVGTSPRWTGWNGCSYVILGSSDLRVEGPVYQDALVDCHYFILLAKRADGEGVEAGYSAELLAVDEVGFGTPLRGLARTQISLRRTGKPDRFWC